MVHAAQLSSQENGRRMWTGAELSKAYHSGYLTPAVVAARILARIEQLQNQAIFIACDAQDIRKQAAESTLR